MFPPDTWRRIVRVAVYAMLVVSAGTTLFVGESLWSAAGAGSLPMWSALVPVATFAAFVVVYGVDRALLVWRRGYPLMRAVVQTGLALAFLTFLLPHQASELRAARQQLGDMDDIDRLLSYRDARVRAAACELAAWRHETRHRSRISQLARQDKKDSVRAACAVALEQLGEHAPSE
ncbi:MAG: hypothetical protein AAB426_14250 [Myxococcota bacterium]